MQKRDYNIENTRGMSKHHDAKPDASGTKGHSKPGNGGTIAGPPPPPLPQKK